MLLWAKNLEGQFIYYTSLNEKHKPAQVLIFGKVRLSGRKIKARPIVSNAKIEEAKNVSFKIWAVIALMCWPISAME